MATDSIGGSGSRDPNYDVRRRMLEEERARELDRIEKRHKEEVQKVQETRDKQLHDIYEDQTTDVARHRDDAENRVAQAKLAAENRVKDFEQDAFRMTEEAKRQFQSKAELLTRNAKEMDHQREFLLKQHNDSMKHLKEEREQRRYEQDVKARQEASQVYLQNKRTIDDLQERANEELNQLHVQTRDAKDREKNEAIRDLDGMKRWRDEAVSSIARDLEHQKREGAQALERDRVMHESAKAAFKEKFESDLGDVHRQAQASVNRAHRDGKALISSVKEAYEAQLSDAERVARERERNMKAQSMSTMGSLENNAKLEQTLAEQGFQHKKQVMQERRDKYLEQAATEQEALKTKISAEYKTAARQMQDVRGQQLEAQLKQTQEELATRVEQGKRQLNAVSAANAQKVSKHVEKTSDPFYRVQELGANLESLENEYVVRIKVPEHERDNVRVTLQNEGLVVTGSRRFEDRAKSEDGRKLTTNAFQSYSETFPVSGKLEMRKMSRTYADGQLTFRIPKG